MNRGAGVQLPLPFLRQPGAQLNTSVTTLTRVLKYTEHGHWEEPQVVDRHIFDVEIEPFARMWKALIQNAKTHGSSSADLPTSIYGPVRLCRAYCRRERNHACSIITFDLDRYLPTVSSAGLSDVLVDGFGNAIPVYGDKADWVADFVALMARRPSWRRRMSVDFRKVERSHHPRFYSKHGAGDTLGIYSLPGRYNLVRLINNPKGGTSLTEGI